MNTNSLLLTIKTLRKSANISQLNMAYALGKKDEDYYGKIERGEKLLHLYPFIKIAHELGLSPAILLYISGIQTFTPYDKITSTTNLQITEEAFEIFQKLEIHCKPHFFKKEFHFYFNLYRAIEFVCKKNGMNVRRISAMINCSENHFYKMQRYYLPITVDAFKNICTSLNCSCILLMLFASNYCWFSDDNGNIIQINDAHSLYPNVIPKQTISLNNP